MATRVTKTGSTDVEFSTAPQPWQIGELDADLDQIFGNITDINVADGAGIKTAKLASDAGITTGMLAALAVTNPKLAVGAAVHTRGSGTPAGGVYLPSAETDMVICTSITTRGGPVLILGALSMLWAGVPRTVIDGSVTTGASVVMVPPTAARLVEVSTVAPMASLAVVTARSAIFGVVTAPAAR